MKASERRSLANQGQTRTRLKYAALFLACVVFGGAAGFVLLEGWNFFDAFYMCLITITTIGYSEIHSLSPAGRVLNSMVILLGVGTFTYTVTQFIHLLVQEELFLFFNRRAMDKNIEKMSDHFIVCGAGRLGMRIALHLRDAKVEFVVMDMNSDICDKLAEEGIPHLVGDATNESVLVRAGVCRARGLVTATGSDPHNVYISLTARDLNAELYIVARANSIDVEPRLVRAGANRVITPERIGSRQMADALLRPVVVDFFDDVLIGGASPVNLEDVPIPAGSPLDGVLLKDVALEEVIGHRINVIMVRHSDGSTTYRPQGTTQIRGGDRILALGDTDSVNRLKNYASERDQEV